ncbi:class I SAM-dependent methyltransferase [Pseudoxanthomonas beigongshangi]
MNTTGIADEQDRLWNGVSGQAWVDQQALLDSMLEPFIAVLRNVLDDVSAARVLDVGCGTGATTLAMAAGTKGQGECTGVDISAPMLALARERAHREDLRVAFIQADAQVYPFPHGHFDRIVSRFGVMFFADPVAAFANLRQAAKADARLRFVAWRGPADNPFMTTAERAAAPWLALPERRAEGPGQFAFADPRRIREVLENAGWRDIGIHPLDLACSLPEPLLIPYITRLGPVGQVLQEADADTRERVIAAMGEAFQPYVHGAEIRFTAACWQVDAHAGGVAP